MSSATVDTVAGLAVRRRHRGVVSGPAVVLVHGAMDRGASFGRVGRRLDGCAVLTVDRRGYGGSAGLPVARTVDAHVDDLCRVLDELDGPHVVVGHSLGGVVALGAAARGLADLVAVGAFEPPVPWLDGTAARIGGGALAVAEAEGPEAAAEHFYRSVVGDAVWARIGPSERAARRAEGPALVAELTDLAAGRPLFDVDALAGPVHLAHGTVGGGPLAAGVELLAGRCGATVTVLDGAPHGAHLSHPDAFAAWVRTVVGAAS